MLDNVVFVLLSSPMFLGGLVGFILDNTIPGTLRERGISQKNLPQTVGTAEQDYKHVYMTPFAAKYIEKIKWSAVLPISPLYNIENVGINNFGDDIINDAQETFL